MPSVRRVAPILVSVAAIFLLLPRSACPQACIGCTPLDDAGGAVYLGTSPPGLYPGPSNAPPPAHLALAMAATADVVPRDSNGAPHPFGWIGFLSIGMSNCNQEFATFERIADSDPGRNARIVIVDGAVGGQAANVIANPGDPYWLIVHERVRAAGLDDDQIQVLWLKEAESALTSTAFPAHAETLQAHLRRIVLNLKDRFPQLGLVFFSSRIYGGYTGSPVLGEPVSYEGGFAFRWLIEDQISGDPGLNADPSAGPVEAPVLLWGPYLWANGIVARPSDGLTWQMADLEADNVHPSPSGETKVAALLDGFFTTDPVATAWYSNDPGATLDTLGAVADAYIDVTQPTTNFGTATRIQWSPGRMRAFVKFDLEGITDHVKHAKLGMKTPPDDAIPRADVHWVANTTWDELLINASNAPPFGVRVDTIPQASRGTALGLDVTARVQAALAQPPGSRRLTLGIDAFPTPNLVQPVLSRESGEGPWLVLTLEPLSSSVRPFGTPSGSEIAIAVGPNPARTFVDVRLDLARAATSARVEILDLRGARVRTLHAGALAVGSRTLRWDGLDERGRAMGAGVYWARAFGEFGSAATRFVMVR